MLYKESLIYSKVCITYAPPTICSAVISYTNQILNFNPGPKTTHKPNPNPNPNHDSKPKPNCSLTLTLNTMTK